MADNLRHIFITFSTIFIISISIPVALSTVADGGPSADDAPPPSWCGSGDDNDIWTQYSSKKCYKLIPQTSSWQQASERCLSLSLPQKPSRLATIKDRQEQNFVSNYLFKRSGPKNTVWLGGFRITDQFLWVDDAEPLNYTNWAAGRPLDPKKQGSQQTQQNPPPQCLAMDLGSKWSPEEQPGNWRDVYCDTKNFWTLCEQTRTIDFGNLTQIMAQFRADLGQVQMGMEHTKKFLDEDRLTIIQAQASIQAAKEEIAGLKQNLMKSQQEFNNTKDELAMLKEEAKQLKNDFKKLVNDVKDSSDKNKETIKSVTELKESGIRITNALIDIQDWAATSASRGTLYSDNDLSGTFENYNVDEPVYNVGCKNLQKIAGSVKSVETFGRCFRVFEYYNCRGSSKAMYPDNGVDHHELNLGFPIRSVGPCVAQYYGTKTGLFIYYK